MIESSIVNGVFLPNRESCLEYLRKLRWPDGVRCPHCGSSRLHRDGYTKKGAAKYHCLNCGRYFNDLTKTIFEHHKFSIEEMFYILKEMENKSTLQISKELGRKYDSVLAFIREVQEIGERHGFLRAWLRKIRGVSKHYLGKYISFFEPLFNSKETWFPSIILFPMV